MLKDGDDRVSKILLEAAMRLAVHGKLKTRRRFYSHRALLMSLVAESREFVWLAVRQIVTLISDTNSNVRTMGADALSKLVEQGRISHFLV